MRVNVTRTFLPPLEEYREYLDRIWSSAWVTNHGPLVLELEARLRDYLGVKHLFFVSNGTLALQIAIRAAGLKGEVITTPFSYVATTSSLYWEGCKPVFADIHPGSLCIDPANISGLISHATTGILATHVYGIPCDIEAIEAVARNNNLTLIYDAAHAFGAKYKGKSLSAFGDISILSFHATKLFHTGEGGAIITDNDELAHRISYMRNFGHNGPEAFYGPGINGKTSELHAAMGLSVFNHIEEILADRKRVHGIYSKHLAGSGLSFPDPGPETLWNYAYVPVIFPSETCLLEARNSLEQMDIFPRRYFYPPLNTLPYLNYLPCPVAEDIARRILCLPSFHGMEEATVIKISDVIATALKSPSC